MVNKKFLQVFVYPKSGVSRVAIEAKLDLGLDWVRYDNRNYILYTTSDIEKWMGRLKPLVQPDGRLFICELKISNRNGWMTKDIWEWLRKKKV